MNLANIPLINFLNIPYSWKYSKILFTVSYIPGRVMAVIMYPYNGIYKPRQYQILKAP